MSPSASPQLPPSFQTNQTVTNLDMEANIDLDELFAGPSAFWAMSPSQWPNQSSLLDPATSCYSGWAAQQSPLLPALAPDEADTPTLANDMTENFVFDGSYVPEPLPFNSAPQASQDLQQDYFAGGHDDATFIDPSLLTAQPSDVDFGLPGDEDALMPYYETDQMRSGSGALEATECDWDYSPLSNALTQGPQPDGQKDGYVFFLLADRGAGLRSRSAQRLMRTNRCSITRTQRRHHAPLWLAEKIWVYWY